MSTLWAGFVSHFSGLRLPWWFFSPADGQAQNAVGLLRTSGDASTPKQTDRRRNDAVSWTEKNMYYPVTFHPTEITRTFRRIDELAVSQASFDGRACCVSSFLRRYLLACPALCPSWGGTDLGGVCGVRSRQEQVRRGCGDSPRAHQHRGTGLFLFGRLFWNDVELPGCGTLFPNRSLSSL